MIASLMDMLFGCMHKNYSFPISTKGALQRRTEASQPTGTYIVCLDCGKEFPYDWHQMKVVSASPARTHALAEHAEALSKTAA